MSGIHCFTSISLNYLARGRVLGRSLRRFHPDWTLWLCITDREPPGFTFDLDDEPFDHVIWVEEVGVPNVKSWIFGHDLVELCTAVKGPVLAALTDSDAEAIFYFDPDIAVLESLEPLIRMLEDHSILLTPHQLTPDYEPAAIRDNEICSLKHGVYNLGFAAIRNDFEGRRFARWWRDRLLDYCHDDISNGLFVDQRWCDLAPAFFPDLGIVRDPGCNVASWNLSQRHVLIDDNGSILVNGHPLRFYHFTKLGSIGDTMTYRYAGNNVEVYEIWTWYKRMVDRYATPSIPADWWYYNTFDDGSAIPRDARMLYRERPELQRLFADPFATDGRSYRDWLQANTDVAM